MRIKIKRKKLIVAISALAVVALAGAAFAYWTAAGTGSGSATAGTDNGVSILGVGFADSLYPGVPVDVRFVIRNDSAKTAAKVGDVVADTTDFSTGVEVVTAPNATDDNPCDATWFTYSGTTVNTEIAASATIPVHAGDGGQLTMSDSSTANQDGCKGATLKLHLKVDNSNI